MRFFYVSFLLLFGCSQQPDAELIINNVNVIDVRSGEVIADQSILINEGQIVVIVNAPQECLIETCELLDGSGAYAAPGLVDMHQHIALGDFSPAPDPEQHWTFHQRLLGWGITTVMNPNQSPEQLTYLRDRLAETPDAAPYLASTGPSIGRNRGWAVVGLDDVEEVREAVQSNIDLGVSAIKIAQDDMMAWGTQGRPVMDQDMLEAVITTAHEAGLDVYAHATRAEFAAQVIEAGADALVHGVIDAPLDASYFEALAERGGFYTPNFVLYVTSARFAESVTRQRALDPHLLNGSDVYDMMGSEQAETGWRSFWNNVDFIGEHLETLYQNAHTASDAGVLMVIGADSIPGVLLGTGTHYEMILAVEAGFSEAEVMRWATVNGQIALGREEVAGTIEPGKIADIILMEDNPLDDMSAISTITHTIRAGRVHSIGG